MRTIVQVFHQPKAKQANSAITSKLRLEVLEDRIALTATGLWERLDQTPDGSDLFSNSASNARAGNSLPQSVVTPVILDSNADDIAAYSVALATAQVEHALATGLAHSLAEVTTDIGNHTSVPTVNLTSAQLATATAQSIPRSSNVSSVIWRLELGRVQLVSMLR